MTPSRVILLVTAAVYASFWIWYGGSGAPMSGAEIAEGLAKLEALTIASGKADSEIPDGFRELLSTDDGREFYMVNLIRFREKALYPEGSEYGDDPMEANARYGEAVVPALLKRGSHPVIMTSVQGHFLPPTSDEKWDQFAIVRYRSRRDMLGMALELGASGGSIHKWASIEKTIVFPVARSIDLFFVRGAVAVVFGTIGGGLAFAVRRRA